MSCVVYCRHYNIGFFGIERLHPFDSHKYGRAYRRLRAHFGRRRLRAMTSRPPAPATRDELLTVHAPEYLQRLQDSAYVAGALELPVLAKLPARILDWAVLRPMRWATAGTVLGAREALRRGFAVNLSGGYHHAKPSAGEGFCIYSDIALAVHRLRAEGLLDADSRIAYIDLDAHQGNGVCHMFRDDPQVFLFDMYNSQIYPLADDEARQRIDCDIPLTSGCGDDEYLGLLRERLPPFLDSISHKRPVSLALYNAGTDIFSGDPLGQLNVSAAGILQRDLFVVQSLRQRNIPTVMLLSGGYTSQSYQLVADSVIRLLEDFK